MIKKPQSKKPTKKPSSDAPSPQVAVTEDEVKKLDKKAKRKKRLYRAGGIFLFLVIVYAAFAPQMGSIHYGICKVLVEVNEPFPNEIKIHQVEDYENIVRIYYSSIGTFGEHRSNQMECVFKIDAEGNILYELDKVNLNGRRKYDIEKPENIAKFNVGVPAIVENPPDLILPWQNLEDIKQYWEAERR